MALVVADRVLEVSTTTGTGTLNLGGTEDGYRTFVAGIGTTNTTFYCIQNRDVPTEWETGIGTVTDAATDTLSRDTVLESSNAGALVNFSAGTKVVFCTLVAERTPTSGGTSTDNAIPRWDGTGAVRLQNSGIIIDDSDNVTGAAALTMDGVLTMAELASPSTPASGNVAIYPKTDGRMYAKNDAGTEFPLGMLGRNGIINGAFTVWQRGTSIVSPTNAQYTADMWRYALGGTMTHTVSQSTDVPTVAEAGRLFQYSMLVDCTTADAAIAAADYCFVDTAIEGYSWQAFAQRDLVLSFWVKATKTGTYCVAVYNSGLDRVFPIEYTVNTTETWEKKTLSITASPSAGTWDYTNGVGARVAFILAAGTDYHGTNATWSSFVDLATANQVNACDSVSNNFRLTGVQLEVGAVATEFEARPHGVELALAHRYFRRYGANVNYNFMSFGVCFSTTGIVSPFKFPVLMRGTPTASTSGASDFFGLDHTASVTIAANSITINNLNPDGCNLQLGFGSAVFNAAAPGGVLMDTTGYLDISAEL